MFEILIYVALVSAPPPPQSQGFVTFREGVWCGLGCEPDIYVEGLRSAMRKPQAL
jgi:hypothetical protein